MPTFTTNDAIELYYTDKGAGLPVLCLSGLTRDHRDFAYMAPFFPDVRLICLDYRGRGKSGWADPATYTIPQEGQDALALLDHLGLEKAAILGTSRGGLIAMGLAAMMPQRLLGAALNDIGPELDGAGMTAIMDYLGRTPVWKTLSEAAAARPGVMAGFAGVPATRWAQEVSHFYTETPEGLQLSYDPRLRDAVEAAGALPLPDLWPFFDAFAGLPATCAVRGQNSDLLSPACFAKMQRRAPNMIAGEVADRGHVPFLDEADALAPLRQWINLLKAQA